MLPSAGTCAEQCAERRRTDEFIVVHDSLSRQDSHMTDTTNGRFVRKRLTATLFATESLFSAAYIASVTLISVNAAELSGLAAMAGVPSTVALLGRAAIGVPAGWFMDRYGRRWLLTLGYLLGAVGLFVSALAVQQASFLVFCLGAGLAGMANGASQQARYVASEVWTAARRARVIGLIIFAGAVGAVGGPLLVAPSVARAQTQGLAPNTGPYLVGAGLTLLAAALVFLLLRPDPMRLSRAMEAARPNALPDVAARALRTIFAIPAVQLATASMVVSQMVMTLIMVITPVHMHDLAHTAGEISLVFMAHTLGMFALAPLTGWLIDRLGCRPMIAYGALLLVVASVMAPLASGVLNLSIALFVLGLGWNFCFVAGSALLSEQLHYHERGQVQGANDVLIALGSGVGSLSTGIFFATGGMLTVGAVGLASTLLLMGVGAWLSHRQSRCAAQTL